MKKYIIIILSLFVVVNLHAGRFCQVHTIYSLTATDSGTTNTSSLNIGEYNEGMVLVNYTAESGTNPTLDITAQTSPDNSTWFNMADSFTQMSAIGKQVIEMSNFGKYIRFALVVGGSGTPTVTVQIDFVGKD